MEKDKLLKLGELSKIMLNSKDIYEAIHKSADLVKDLIEVDRVSIFIFENGHLWTLRADYTEKIEIPDNKGIVGYVAKEKKPYITNDAYNDEYFEKSVDLKTGFTTKNILAVPIVDTVGKLIGVVEFINKKNDFNEKDIVLGKLYAQYVSEPIKFHLGII
jgi:GAF domain-containing protein